MTFELFLQLSNITQMGLTVVLLLMIMQLFHVWWPSFQDAMKVAFTKGVKWTAEQWLVVGIVIGFLGNMLDNIFWGIVWMFKFVDESTHQALFELGPTFNVVFRQIFGIFAVYCHLFAAMKMSDRDHAKIPLGMYLLAGLGVTLIFLF